MTTAVCVHHILFEPPAGPTSLGVCKKCGAKFTGSNREPDSNFRTPGKKGRKEPALHGSSPLSR